MHRAVAGDSVDDMAKALGISAAEIKERNSANIADFSRLSGRFIQLCNIKGACGCGRVSTHGVCSSVVDTTGVVRRCWQVLAAAAAAAMWQQQHSTQHTATCGYSFSVVVLLFLPQRQPCRHALAYFPASLPAWGCAVPQTFQMLRGQEAAL
jgi:hypothetical protein